MTWEKNETFGGGATATMDILQIEQEGQTIIVTPVADLRELSYREIEAGLTDVLERLATTGAKNVVLDFHRTDYYGTTALSCFVTLWKRVSSRGGKMAFCNVSDHEREILQVTKMDHLWPIFASRAAALQAVQK